MLKKKGFTLIELLAVLVVIAMLALISIPIIIRIINNARENSAKRSIAAYGRAVELAISEELMKEANTDYNALSTMYKNNKLNIKYTGQNVTCKNLKMDINNDIIIRGCHTSNSKVYKYQDRQVMLQEDTYNIGDLIYVNGIKFYVIKDSPKTEDYVVAFKEEPFTKNEIDSYGGVGTNHNRVNEYYTNITSWPSYKQAESKNGYGLMAYYTSETCGSPNGKSIYTGCTNDYQQSDIKVVIDKWVEDKFQNNELKIVDNYDARLMNLEELKRFGYNISENTFYIQVSNPVVTKPHWFYNALYSYWTMAPYQNGNSYVWRIENDARLDTHYDLCVVRPVINVKKSSID